MTNEIKHLRVAALVVIVPLAACATWRWSGYPPRDVRTSEANQRPMPAEGESPPELNLSSSPAVAYPSAILPPTSPAKLKKAAYPADLGSEAVDVSSYPRQIRADYKVYARVCSKCHTLARANYSEHVDRSWWALYITRMRARASWKNAPLSADEVQAILEFIEYDSHARKDGRLTDFKQVNEELTRRFNASMDSRMQRMQKGRPLISGE
jgi:cytochrome c5